MTLPLLKWTDLDLACITVLQLVKALDCYRVAYCSGEKTNGDKVLVMLPFTKLPIKGLRFEIVKQAKRDGVFAAGLNVFDAIEISP